MGLPRGSEVTGGRRKEELKNKIRSALERHFRPEFLNRLDEIIIFNSLTPEILSEIVQIQLDRVSKRLEAKQISIKVSAEAKTFLAREGYDAHYGARPLKRLIQNQILNPMAELIVGGKLKAENSVEVTVRDGVLVIESDDKTVLKVIPPVSRKKKTAPIVS